MHYATIGNELFTCSSPSKVIISLLNIVSTSYDIPAEECIHVSELGLSSVLFFSSLSYRPAYLLPK